MKNDKKRQILFFISLIGIIVVLLTMGTTFAYQTIIVDYKEGSDNDLSLNAAKLDIDYTAGDKIELTNMPLLKDYKTADYTEFTIDNKNSSGDIAYSIDLTNLEYSKNIVSSDFKYTLVLINGESKNIIGSGDFSTLTGNTFKLYFNLGAYRILGKGNNETVRLYLWLKETENDQNGLESTSFKGQIQISSMFSSDVNSIKTLSIKGNSVQDNLFDPNTITEGYYYDDLGNYTTSSLGFVSDYINVNAGTDYTIKGINNYSSNSNFRINYFDSNKNWLSSMVYSILSNAYILKNVIVPENAHYVRISSVKVNVNDIIFYQTNDTTINAAYPVKIKSLGRKIENESSNNGKYEIPIGVSSKNMINVPDMNIKPKNTYYHNYFPTNPKVLLEPSTTYTLSFDYVINSTTQTLSTGIGYGTSYYAADIIYGKQFPNETSGKQVITFTTPKTFNSEQTPYLQLRIVRASFAATADVSISNVQLEKGSGATDYVPYKEPVIYNIYLDEPLRKVGDYYDYIDYSEGKVVRNIKYEYLNTVTAKSSNAGTYSIFLTDISKKPLVTKAATSNSVGYAMSNKFNYTTKTYGNLVSTPNVIQPYITNGGVNRIAYTFDDSSINTVELAQEKIGDGFEVQYVMNESEIEYIELPSLKDLDSNSNITVCSSNNVCASNIE